MRRLLPWLLLASTLSGCPAEPPPPPPTPKATPKPPEEQPRFCVFKLEGADFGEGEEIALVPDDRADHGYWLYDAERDQTRLGWVGTWKTWEVHLSLALPGARALGTYSRRDDDPLGYHADCELSFYDPKIPREERPLLYLTEGSVTLTDLTGPVLEGTLEGTYASRRGAGTTETAPVGSWARAHLTQGRFKANFDGAQQGAQRWPGSD